MCLILDLTSKIHVLQFLFQMVLLLDLQHEVNLQSLMTLTLLINRSITRVVILLLMSLMSIKLLDLDLMEVKGI